MKRKNKDDKQKPKVDIENIARVSLAKSFDIDITETDDPVEVLSEEIAKLLMERPEESRWCPDCARLFHGTEDTPPCLFCGTIHMDGARMTLDDRAAKATGSDYLQSVQQIRLESMAEKAHEYCVFLFTVAKLKLYKVCGYSSMERWIEIESKHQTTHVWTLIRLIEHGFTREQFRAYGQTALVSADSVSNLTMDVRCALLATAFEKGWGKRQIAQEARRLAPAPKVESKNEDDANVVVPPPVDDAIVRTPSRLVFVGSEMPKKGLVVPFMSDLTSDVVTEFDPETCYVDIPMGETHVIRLEPHWTGEGKERRHTAFVVLPVPYFDSDADIDEEVDTEE